VQEQLSPAKTRPPRQDAALKNLPAGLPPAKAYLDEQAYYASNEVAINWNAPLVFLLASALPEK
jgi:endoglucanase